MDHNEIRQLLPAYVDLELNITDALAVERHLETCHACRLELEEQRAASARMRTGAPYFDASPALRARLVQALPAQRAPRSGSRSRQPFRAQAAAALALVSALGWAISAYRTPSPQQRLTGELVASHVRSLQVDHLADVASSDRHTVKPWFIGKLNFAPPVVDLAPQGFPLVGGRLDYLDDRDVAVLVYRRHRHPINLYIWPGADMPAAPRTSHLQGYHLVRWSDGRMNFSAVSDLADSDLAQFVQTLRPYTKGS